MAVYRWVTTSSSMTELAMRARHACPMPRVCMHLHVCPYLEGGIRSLGRHQQRFQALSCYLQVFASKSANLLGKRPEPKAWMQRPFHIPIAHVVNVQALQEAVYKALAHLRCAQEDYLVLLCAGTCH